MSGTYDSVYSSLRSEVITELFMLKLVSTVECIQNIFDDWKIYFSGKYSSLMRPKYPDDVRNIFPEHPFLVSIQEPVYERYQTSFNEREYS